MRFHFFLVILIFFINENALPQSKVTLPSSFVAPMEEEIKKFFPISKGQLDDLRAGNVISEGDVKSPSDKDQEMHLFVAGIHPRNCTRAMRKLSLYENYSQYIDFIKESKYDENNQKIHFIIDHTLLPFPMSLSFKIPRITKEGHYPFTFDNGFLKDLKGTVVVKEVGKFCLLGLKTDWRGPQSKIPNLVFETFVETAAKLGLEHLIRVSLF
jgi:hypothetical protein